MHGAHQVTVGAPINAMLTITSTFLIYLFQIHYLNNKKSYVLTQET